MYGINMAKGLLVTLKNLTKKPFTVQYPEERVKQHPRFRGEEFVWYEERCTGCASCAKYCPLGIIKIVTTPSETAPAQGDKYKLEVFDISINRCMFCGLCVEACPYDALYMGSGFEQGRSEEHTSELQSLVNLVCRLLLEKKKIKITLHIRSRITLQVAHVLCRAKA